MSEDTYTRYRVLALDEATKVLRAERAAQVVNVSWLNPYLETLVKMCEKHLKADQLISVVMLGAKEFFLSYDKKNGEFIITPTRGYVPMARFDLTRMQRCVESGTSY